MKILILGSCVSRDALSFVTDSRHTVIDYYARSSVASAFSETRFTGPEAHDLKSPFQARMVAADLDKSLASSLGILDFDVLLYDPIDERFDLLRASNGAICTLSSELASIGKGTEGAERIKSRSEEFFGLWEAGWVRLVRQLKESSKLSLLRVNQVYWATSTIDGGGFGTGYNARLISSSNLFLARLYRRMELDLDGSQFYRFGPEELVGSSTHKWGAAPFHFADAYYLRLVQCFDSERPLALRDR